MDASINRSVADILANKNRYILVDVREPAELAGPEGFIKDAILAPLGLSLIHFLNVADPTKTYVFICRSGHRSAHACEIAASFGFQNVFHLEGGMLAWKENH